MIPSRKNRVQVIERNELWGYVSYKVYDPVDGNIYQIASDYLDELDKGYCSENYIRYITSLARVKDTVARGMFSRFSENCYRFHTSFMLLIGRCQAMK